MDFLKSVGGKVVSGLVGLAVIAGGISWWRMDEHTKTMILGGTGKIFGWLMIVLLVPWVTFFLIGKVAKLESNLAGGLLVFVYTLIEVLVLLWMFSWDVHGTGAWTAVAVGGLFAGVYNLLTCDWLAERFEG